MQKQTFLSQAWFESVAAQLPGRTILPDDVDLSAAVIVVGGPSDAVAESAMYASEGRVEWTTNVPNEPHFRVTIPFDVLKDIWLGAGLAAAADAYTKGLIQVEGDTPRFSTLIDTMSQVFSQANDGAANIRALSL